MKVSRIRLIASAPPFTTSRNYRLGSRGTMQQNTQEVAPQSDRHGSAFRCNLLTTDLNKQPMSFAGAFSSCAEHRSGFAP